MNSIDIMKPEVLPSDINILKDLIIEQKATIIKLEDRIKVYEHKLFGKKSEKCTNEEENQKYLFNEAELEIDEEKKETESETKEEVITVPEHTRKKTSSNKFPPDLPRKIIIHDLAADEKICKCCNKERPCIGSDITERVEIIPQQIIIEEHRYLKYAECNYEACKINTEKETVINTEKEQKIIQAPREPRLLPKTNVSEGLLAYLMVCKFCDSLPFYRMEKILLRSGINISRSEMCNWTIKISRTCQDLLELMWNHVRAGPFIQMDETIFQVLKEPGRAAELKSYMWLTIGYKDMKPIVIYHYHPSRSKEIPLHVLKGFSGYLQTDGYAGYNNIGASEGIIHVGCFAHARRYFFEALKASANNKSANEGLSLINNIFSIEKKLRIELDSEIITKEEFVEKRKEESMPILKKLNNWLIKKNTTVLPKSALGKAVNYSLNEWDKMIKYLDAWFLTPSNNNSENKIRPFVVGRKNWLFAVTPSGAHASATIYSLIETAKANNLDPYKYLKYIFKKIPSVTTEFEKELLLPINLTAEIINDN